jgi:hypothetical protein
MEEKHHRADLSEKLYKDRESRPTITEILMAMGLANYNTDLLGNEPVGHQLLKKKKRGLALGAIGTLLLMTGFFLTPFLFQADNSFDLTLYGITSAGILFLFWGMAELPG